MDELATLVDIEGLQYVGMAATAAVAVWQLWKRLKPWIVRVIMAKIATSLHGLSGHHEDDEQAHQTIMRAIDKLGIRLDQLASEWQPNGGMSARDSLNRMEKTLSYLGAFQISTLHTWDKAIFITNEDGFVTYVNATHSRLTGFRPDECMGLEWINMVIPEEREKMMLAWQHAVNNGIIFDKIMTLIKPGNVEPYKVKVHAVKIQTHGHNPVVHGYFGELTPI